MTSRDIRKLQQIVWPAFQETIYMVFFTLCIATIVSLIISTILYISKPNSLRPHKRIYQITTLIINIIRSFPFTILVVAIIPFTRFLIGTIFGKKAALVPLVITATALITRLFEGSFNEVDTDLIEAAKSFGANPWEIMREVVYVEALPSMVSNLTLATISILSFSAAAGSIGAGGLGNVAMNYGYFSYDNIMMYGISLILIILVQIIQWIGQKIYLKLSK